MLLWLEPSSGQFLLRDKPGSPALSWPGTALFYTVATLFLPTSLIPPLCRCALLCAAGGLSLSAPLCLVRHTVHPEGSEGVELVTSGLTWIGSVLQIQEKDWEKRNT